MAVTTTQHTTSSPLAIGAERYLLGRMGEFIPISPERFGFDQGLAPREVFAVDVHDPYLSEVDPDTAARIIVAERLADLQARERRHIGAWQRRPETAYIDIDGNTALKARMWGDPVERSNFFDGLGSAALNAWLELIPSARALTVLADPKLSAGIVMPDDSVVEIDDTARQWMAVSTDAVAIRNRGTVMAELARKYVMECVPAEKRDELVWMSVASGTALPSMKGAMQAGISPRLILADHDVSALRAAKALGREIGFGGQLMHRRTNIFNPSMMGRLQAKLEEKGLRPQLMDYLGIFEYAGPHTGVDPSQFLSSGYDMLAPGGRIIGGQMRNDRPVPDFTMGVVGWPYVVMRSPAETMRIIDKAGIPPECVSFCMPSDGVYSIFTIDKPLDTATSQVAA